ncbi:MAG: hypothetical protein K9H84_03135 [Bacteroidales bacterium]|nr:hypothetical protein [Bacteroidales bacterium]
MNKTVYISIVIRAIVVGFVFLTGTYLKSQTVVLSDNFLVENRSGIYQWKINGVTFGPTKEKVLIYPNYPQIDTIIFEGAFFPNKPDTIYTRIPQNHTYLMTIGCCNTYFEMYKLYNNSVIDMSGKTHSNTT